MIFERTKNTARNFVFGTLHKVVSMVMPFIARTIIIQRIGEEYLGLTSLFTSVISMLNMAELGIGTAIAFCMYKPIAENDNDTACALLNLYKTLYRIIGCIVLTVGLALMPFVGRFINGTPPAGMNIYILYAMYLAQTVLSYLLFSYKSVIFNVNQRRDIINKINIVVDIVKYILQIVVLVVLKDYYIYVLLLLIAQIAINISYHILSNKHFPHLQPQGKVSAEIKAALMKKTVYLAAHAITGRFSSSIGNIIISAALGLVPIALYGNYTYISGALMGFIVVGFASVKSSVGNILYAESGEQTVKTYKMLYKLVWMSSTVCGICLACLYQDFMLLWIGEQGLLSVYVAVGCSISFYLSCQLEFLNIYVSPAGIWEKILPGTIVSVIVSTMLNLYLIKRIGVVGIVLTLILVTLMVDMPVNIRAIYKYVLKLSMGNGLWFFFAHLVITVVIGVVTYFTLGRIPVANFGMFILKGCIIFTVLLVFLVAISWRTEEFSFLLDRLKGLLGCRLKKRK